VREQLRFAKLILCVALGVQSCTVMAREGEDPRPQVDLQARLESVLQRLTQIQQNLEEEIESVRKDLEGLKREKTVADRGSDLQRREEPPEALPIDSQTDRAAARESSEFRDRILSPDLGLGERDQHFFKKPTVFLQTRYSVGKVRGVSPNEGYEANFDLNRLEFAMEGRLTEKFGMGFEIQYHPATDGSSEELVNLAYLDYYLNSNTTVRAGQFVRPFGFDIQQSSFDRENPERMNAVGYFFPGQRDRGILLQGNLDSLNSRHLRNIAYWVGITNGNNFFDDNNANVNFNFRLRKSFLDKSLAAGVSGIVGKQPLPPGVQGNNNGNVWGLDLQWQKGPLGLRGEFISGNMPSTLLSLPFPESIEFAPAFQPGRFLTGGHMTGILQVTQRANIYFRFDQMNSDVVTGFPIRAFNVGYLRLVSPNVRLMFDYQFKNRPSFNDDAQNQRLAVTLNSEF
jgi:Phosphate-selective porin O and P